MILNLIQDISGRKEQNFMFIIDLKRVIFSIIR